MSLSSDDTHTPLALKIFRFNVDAPIEVVKLVCKELFETLTIRSLLNLCTACKQTPTSAMLAIALQNSIPSLTGLPMDNPDPGFYLDIAKRFFAPVVIGISRRTDMYNALYPGRFFGSLVSRADLETPQGDFSSGICYYIYLILFSCNLVHTKKGRDFIKGIVTEWLCTPHISPCMEKVYRHLLNVLDHGLVLRCRKLEPGGVARIFNTIGDDEHL